MKVDVIFFANQTPEQVAAEEVAANIGFHSVWNRIDIEMVSATGFPSTTVNEAKVVTLLRSSLEYTKLEADIKNAYKQIDPTIHGMQIALIQEGQKSEYSVLCFVPYEVND